MASGCLNRLSKSPTSFNLDSQLQTGGPALQKVFSNPQAYRAQVLITEVVRTPNGKPGLRQFRFRAGSEYFYPASSIKLCAAIAALQSLTEHSAQARIPAIDWLHAPIQIAPLFPGDAEQSSDLSNEANQKITIGHELRKLAIVSDNQAFNRLFDVVGLDSLNQQMHDLGLSSVRIRHRLSDPRSIPHGNASAAVRILPLGLPPVSIPARLGSFSDTNSAPGLLIGEGFMRAKTRLNGPTDFSTRNGISLDDLQTLLILLARPDILPAHQPRLQLHPTYRTFLLEALTMYPHESTNPRYIQAEFPDDYSKFLLPGVRRVFPSSSPQERIQITGKIGRAYGFSTENAWLRNPSNGREVFVAATLYTNSDGILNDDRYDYESVADPFFADLGELVARTWLSTAPTSR